jgi:hypothetical protein
MKSPSIIKFGERNYFGPIMIFFSSIALGYALINQYVYDQPKSEILTLLICMFFGGLFSTLRTKYTK